MKDFILFLFGMLALIILFLITLTVRSRIHAPISETEQMRAIWPLTLYFIGLSFALRTLTLHFMKWGEIKQCLSASLMMYCPSLLMLSIFLLLIGKGDFSTREFLGGFLWWQNIFVIFLVPLPIAIEGFLLQVVKSLSKKYPYREPWRSAIYSNLMDAVLRFSYFSILFP